MPTLESHINKALFYNSQSGTRRVPQEVILANCLIAGFDEEAVHEELDRLVAQGYLSEQGGQYGRVEDLQ